MNRVIAGKYHSILNNIHAQCALQCNRIPFKDQADLIFHLGWDALDTMEKIPVDAEDTPLTDIILKSVTIHANPLAG